MPRNGRRKRPTAADTALAASVAQTVFQNGSRNAAQTKTASMTSEAPMIHHASSRSVRRAAGQTTLASAAAGRATTAMSKRMNRDHMALKP
jgi:hypothetical protein